MLGNGFIEAMRVATTILAGRDGQSSRPPASACEGHRFCRYTVRANSIDTHRGSLNSRYVKSFVRGFRCPALSILVGLASIIWFGITTARSSYPKLRMLSATMNRVPASIWDKRHAAFVSGRLTTVMVGRGPQTATRYSTALSRSRLLDHGRLRWTQVDCVGPLSPLLTAKAP